MGAWTPCAASSAAVDALGLGPSSAKHARQPYRTSPSNRGEFDAVCGGRTVRPRDRPSAGALYLAVWREARPLHPGPGPAIPADGVPKRPSARSACLAVGAPNAQPRRSRHPLHIRLPTWHRIGDSERKQGVRYPRSSTTKETIPQYERRQDAPFSISFDSVRMSRQSVF